MKKLILLILLLNPTAVFAQTDSLSFAYKQDPTFYKPFAFKLVMTDVKVERLSAIDSDSVSFKYTLKLENTKGIYIRILGHFSPSDNDTDHYGFAPTLVAYSAELSDSSGFISFRKSKFLKIDAVRIWPVSGVEGKAVKFKVKMEE